MALSLGLIPALPVSSLLAPLGLLARELLPSLAGRVARIGGWAQGRCSRLYEHHGGVADGGVVGILGDHGVDDLVAPPSQLGRDSLGGGAPAF